MLPLIAGLAVGNGLKVLGPLIGDALSRGDRKEAERLIKEAYAQYDNLSVPEFEKILAQELGPSAMEALNTDPRLTGAQYHALDKMQAMGDSGGLTQTDLATLERLQGDVARRESAGLDRVMEKRASQGALSGGDVLATALDSNQAASNQMHENSARTAGRAQDRAFDAIMAAGDMGGKMRGQEFSEKQRIAEAKDAIARYNAGARTNAANQRNQNLQLGYTNTLGLTDRRVGAKKGMADVYSGKADRTMGMWSGVGEALGGGVLAGTDYYMKGQKKGLQGEDDGGPLQPPRPSRRNPRWAAIPDNPAGYDPYAPAGAEDEVPGSAGPLTGWEGRPRYATYKDDDYDNPYGDY